MRDDDKPLTPRKRPSQARSRQTVEWILEGAARVFRREGWDATTNRIAEAAGVSVGSLYEYFPNKQALVVALAERHLDEAERGLDAALTADHTLPERLAAIQTAILESQRFPSEALDVVSSVPEVGPSLGERARGLRERVLEALATEIERARPDLADPKACARAVLSMIGDASCRALFESPEDATAVATHLLAMAVRYLAGAS